MADKKEMPDEKRVKQSGKEHQPAQVRWYGDASES
jgi:hypothetical protein